MVDERDLSRRQFVVLAATCAAACACGSTLAAADGAHAAGPSTAPAETVDVGTMADYAKDGVFGQHIKAHKLIVYREQGQIYASTAVCPHRGAALQIKDGTPFCPKHGSAFSEAGTVTKGPAKSSLERFAISKDASGHLIVDPGKTFREKLWDDPASFVKVQ